MVLLAMEILQVLAFYENKIKNKLYFHENYLGGHGFDKNTTKTFLRKV